MSPNLWEENQACFILAGKPDNHRGASKNSTSDGAGIRHTLRVSKRWAFLFVVAPATSSSTQQARLCASVWKGRIVVLTSRQCSLWTIPCPLHPWTSQNSQSRRKGTTCMIKCECRDNHTVCTAQAGIYLLKFIFGHPGTLGSLKGKNYQHYFHKKQAAVHQCMNGVHIPWLWGFRPRSFRHSALKTQSGKKGLV